MSKHTPGPWAHENYQGVIHVFVDNQGGTPSVCKLIGPDKEANASLIAAAPDLLDVVQAVADWNAQYPSSRIYSETSIRKIAAEMNAINDKARAAIAKATGEQA